MTQDVPDEPLSILIVDDDDIDRMAVMRALRATHLAVEISEVGDAPEALMALRHGRFDCAVVDFNLPRGDALSILRIVASEQLITPVVVLTGQGDEQLAVEIMKAGAADYISKGGLSGERLRRSIVQAVRLRRAELAAAAERARITRLQHFSATLAAKRSAAEVADTVATEGGKAFGAARAVFYVLSRDEQAIELLGHHNYTADFLQGFRRIERDAALPIAECVRSMEPLLFESGEQLVAQYPEVPIQQPGGALVALPMVVDQRCLGVVGLAYDVAQSFSDGDRREFIAFARVCAQALDRAQLFDFAQAERRRAEEASRAKDEFLAVVSHELRTPLSAILGWAKMLNTGSLTPEQAQRATATIERNATSQAQLIEDLLDVSRITTGKLKIETGSVELASVLEAAMDVIRAAADGKGIRMVAQLDRRLGPIVGDAGRLQQVFWNLLSNAVKFTPRGGRVQVDLSAHDGLHVVRVSDSGQGIAPEFLPHVFERFRQEDAGASRSASGLGLGLSIARHIVELHGGTIEASSEGVGKGSSFVVRLPTASRPARDSTVPPLRCEPEAPSATARAPQSGREPQLRGVRVLVVDDEADVRELLEAVLASFHAEVVTASSAREAFDELRRFRPDVLISDIAMPVEDGYMLIERVRGLSEEQGGNTPAIALTAFARGEDRTKALLAGFTRHAAKPIEPNELARLIVDLLG